MAYQVGIACYETAAQAAQAVASSNLGGIVSHAGNAYLISAGSITDTGIEYLLSPVGGGTPLSLAGSFQAQPCNLLTASDGLQMGWMVAGVWIAVWAVMFLARALYTGGGDSDYGNA